MKKYIFILSILTVFTQACDVETELDVKNIENPTTIQLGTSEATAKSLFQGWYHTVNDEEGPGCALATMSDNITCSWGNFGMRDTSSEPRITWNNSPNYSNSNISESYFNSLHSVLADANAIIASLQGGTNFSDNDMIESLGYFGQGVSLGYLGLVYDKVYPSDETGFFGESIPYNEAIDLALEKIDLAIVAADRGSFELEGVINGTTISSAQWSQFLNSLGARILANSARNATEKSAIDWDKVLDYTNNGLTFDIVVLNDGWSGDTWFAGYSYYTTLNGWGRVDMRTINLMDNSYPDYWPEGAISVDPATTDDLRLASDFEYLDSQWFIPSRGEYHYSSYRYRRYSDFTSNDGIGNHTEFLVAENDLYKAEALYRTGDLSGAAAVLNAGSRSLRGGLADITATESEIIDAIHYERMVELISTGMGLSFFDMRGKNLLQEGTLLHFPIPGAALDAAGEESYTFGGTEGTPGEDYSNEGWR